MVKKFNFSFNMQLLCITPCTIKKMLVSLAEVLTDLSISNPSLLHATWQNGRRFLFVFFFAKARFVWEKFNKKCTLILPKSGWQILAVLAPGVKMDIFQISQKL